MAGGSVTDFLMTEGGEGAEGEVSKEEASGRERKGTSWWFLFSL